MHRHDRIVLPPSHKGEGVRPHSPVLLLVGHLIGEGDLSAKFRRHAQQFKRRVVQDDLLFPFRLPAFFQIDVAPFCIIFVHVADFRRDSGKGSLRDDPRHNPLTGGFHLLMPFDLLCLFICHVLKGAVGVPADLSESVGLIALI